MAENDSSTTQPAATAGDPPESQMNDQIRDALEQLQTILAGADSTVFQAAVSQTFAHVVALTMHNAVAEQQQNNILRLALTTSAANAILAGKRAEAEGILELARTHVAAPDLSGMLTQIRSIIEEIGRVSEAARPSPAPPNPTPPAPANAAEGAYP